MDGSNRPKFVTSDHHRFSLAGMKPGDWFMGCPVCWTQYPTNSAGPTQCQRGGEMLIYTVTHADLPEIRSHNERAGRLPQKVSV